VTGEIMTQKIIETGYWKVDCPSCGKCKWIEILIA